MSQSRSKSSALKRTTLAAVLGLCLSQMPAMAQSTAGDIVGSATYAAGAQVQIKSLSSGVSRSVALGSDGKFRIPSLPTGAYEVSLIEGGSTVSTLQVTVIAGQAVQANFADAKSLDAVVVKAPMVVGGIDASSVESRTTFTAEQLNELPVPRDVSSVARLTPGTTQGSGYFGNLNSFGGASVAENAYYVNGMNVTNSYDYLSFSEVPWQAIDQLDVQTGGYGAEYGFSTGGVTSVNIKRGTNEWHGGVSIDSSPDWARAHLDDEYFSNGSLFRPLSKNKTNQNTYTLWEGGPLIQDKLFIFALASLDRTTGSSWNTRSSSSSTSSTMYDYTTNKPYKLIKLDWYLNDWNHLEFTGFDNSSRTSYSYSKVGYDGNTAYKSAYNGQLVSKSGGPTTIFKWTSNLTDDLTMSAQYGRMKTKSEQYTVSPDGTVTTYSGDVNSSTSSSVCPRVYYNTSKYTGAQNSCYISSTLGVSNGYSQRDDYRLDFDWTLGNHELKFGYDYNDVNVKAGETYSGGHYYYYYSDTYVYDYVYKTGGKVEVKQNSWYIQDKWHITDNFLLSMGIRNDGFKNYNTSGEVFVKQDNIWQPRLGFSWDVNGDGRSRLYGNLGRYALPIAANVALRAASSSYYTYTLYTYTGVSSDGTPTGLSQVGDTSVVNGENGSMPDAKSVTSKNLKPYTQDEAILGYQYTLSTDNDFLNDWVLGIKATYRKVHNAIDDTCSASALYNAASAAGYDVSSWDDEWTTPSGIAGCWLYNPGSSSTITTDVDGDGNAETVTMSASSLGPKARRTYKAVTLTAEKGTDKWYGNFSYTWSKSQGNYEGLVKSNNGQDDTGTTSDFDFAEIMQGSYGYLANDRRHQIKLYGGYKFTPEWQVGLNVSIQSGAPISCYGGGYGTLGTYYGYGGAWHYCNGEISQQGSQGRTPWTYTFSPNLVYKPKAVKGLTVQLTVLNIFNNVKPLQVYQTYESTNSKGTTTYEYYKLGQYYTDPRTASLQVMYEW
ncbi:MAG: TonB-dependent receptor [Pseudomonas sp.]